MAFLSAYAEVQSDYLMTVRAKSGRNKYGKIDWPGLSSFFQVMISILLLRLADPSIRYWSLSVFILSVVGGTLIMAVNWTSHITSTLENNNLIIPNLSSVNASEVSPAWLRYELPKLGIAGSNPALRMFLSRCYGHWTVLSILLLYNNFSPLLGPPIKGFIKRHSRMQIISESLANLR